MLGGNQAARTTFPVASNGLAEKPNVFQTGQVKPSGQRSEGLAPPLRGFTMSGEPPLSCAPNEACAFCGVGLQWGLSEVMNHEYLRMTKRRHPGRHASCSANETRDLGLFFCPRRSWPGLFGRLGGEGSVGVPAQTHACSRRDRCVAGGEGGGGGASSCSTSGHTGRRAQGPLRWGG